jgi:trimeric autotransporter adhesin
VYKTTDGGISWPVKGLVAFPSLDVPARIPGGTYKAGFVFLPFIVPDDEAAYVYLWSSNGSAASVPSDVIIWSGFYSAGFVISTTPVSENTPVEIFASLEGTTTSVVTVVEPAAISDFRVDPTSVAAGGQSTGIVTLSGPAPSSGAVVALAGSAPAVAVPVGVTVAPGATTATFTISTNPVAATTPVTISATLGAVTRNAVLTVNPLTLSSVFLAPSTVTGGGSSSGTVTLSGPAPTAGAVVALSSSNAASATVPANVVVPAGSTSATFTVSTSASCAPATATIGATYAGVSASTVLTILPRPADTVTIQRADYFRNRQVLRVSATSSMTTAALHVFVTSSGALIGGLTNQGGGSYSGEYNLQPSPQSITVRSSACGSATKYVDVK